MRILPDQIRIRQGRDDVWSLEVVLQPTSSVSFATVRLRLDPSMLALPVPNDQHNNNLSISVGFGVIAASIPIPLNSPSVRVSHDSREVEFGVHELTRRIGYLPTKIGKTILFEWFNRSSLPKKVEIVAEIKTPLGNTRVEKLVGYNVKESLIEFVAARKDTRFHFPWTTSALKFDTSLLYEYATRIQSLNPTTIRGVSGPHEVWFWRTASGAHYLRGQIQRLRANGERYRPTRIGLCPFDFESDERTRRTFLAEMQSQYDCGVDIRMVDQRSLENVVGNADIAIAVFGDTLGIMLHGIHGSRKASYGELALDQTRLTDLGYRFRDLYRTSWTWERYRTMRSIDFNNRTLLAIKQRRDAILSNASVRNLGG
jgi:hypothetical protein